MIPQSTIQNILSTAKIEEVIDEFITLKQRGVNFIALCPFHNEKTPSFTVSPAKSIYKCFGCGAAGNVTNFVMEHEGYSYPEALRYLAKKYNIEIEELSSDELQEERKDQQLKESLHIINNFAKDYFMDILHNHEEGKNIGLSYFRERKFKDEVVRKFELGFSPTKKDAFKEALNAKKHNPTYARQLGLISSQGLDFFRERVMFPIHNLSGKVIAFGGRTLKSDKKIPKYINSPESPIYHKSDSVYGMYFAKEAIRKNDQCLLVEGYTDVISLYQAGIENVVASSGTSLTKEQVRLISRYSKKCFHIV